MAGIVRFPKEKSKTKTEIMVENLASQTELKYDSIPSLINLYNLFQSYRRRAPKVFTLQLRDETFKKVLAANRPICDHFVEQFSKCCSCCRLMLSDCIKDKDGNLGGMVSILGKIGIDNFPNSVEIHSVLHVVDDLMEAEKAARS